MLNYLPKALESTTIYQHRQIVLDKNNTLWYFVQGSSNRLAYYTSDDYGENWSSEQFINDPTYPNSGAFSADIDDNNYIHLAYERNSQIQYVIKDGSGWGSEVQISSGTPAPYLEYVSVYGNKIYIVYSKGDNVWVAKKIGAGSWTNTKVIDDATAYRGLSLLSDTNDDLMLIYRTVGTVGYYAQYDESAGTWSSGTLIDDTNFQPIGGLIVISDTFYIFGRYLGNPDLVMYSKTFSAGSWTKTVIASTTNGLAFASGQDTSGNLVLYYAKNVGAFQNEIWMGVYTGTWAWTKLRDTNSSTYIGAVWNYYADNKKMAFFGNALNQGFYTDTGLINIAETGTFSDDLEFQKNLLIEETGTLDDNVVTPFFDIEPITVDDTFHLTPRVKQLEEIVISDSEEHYELIHPKEQIKVSDNVQIETLCPYVRWIINTPLNENFSFEDFTDGYTFENVTIIEHSESLHYHCLDLIFGLESGVTSGEESYFQTNVTVDPNTRYRFWLGFYRIENDFTVTIYSTDTMSILAEFDSIHSADDWNYWNVSFRTDNTNSVIVKIESEDAHIYLDNFAVVKISQIRNPESFKVGYNCNQMDDMDLNGKNIVPINNFNEVYKFGLNWSLITYEETSFLKSLRRTKILVRTHDMKDFAVVVDNINISIPPRYEEKGQKYDVRINCHVY